MTEPGAEVRGQPAIGAPAEPFKGPEEATLTAKDLKPLGGRRVRRRLRAARSSPDVQMR
jgi:hypothetical protein